MEGQPKQRSTQAIIGDIVQMGFERWRVERVLQGMVAEGKPIDLNAVVDRVMAEQR